MSRKPAPKVARGTRQAITIRDVARRAGVSTATVSRALASPGVVSEDARDRVLAAIRATGYIPNVAAQNLRARRTRMVLVVVPNIANSFFAEVLRGIDDELAASGYGLIIGNLDNLAEREPRYVDLVLAGQVDGVLLMSSRIPAGNGRLMTDAGVPIATLCVAIPATGLASVMVDDWTAARAVAEHLLALGHRRFGYVSGPAGNMNEIGRRTGFAERLAEEDLDAEALTCWDGDFTLESGVRAAQGFLALPSPPTAVFAASDHMAIGFMKTLRSAGVEIPADVSVVGFDGIEFAEFVEPTLSTVSQPRHALGRTGARLLLETMATGKPASSVHLEAPLILRQSTAAAKGGI